MSNQNRFLLPHSATPSTTGQSHIGARAGGGTSEAGAGGQVSSSGGSQHSLAEQENNLSVDTDFDSYWEEEARNPHRNRIRIGRQYQATVPPLLKAGEKDQRKLDELETLSFCPKKSARVSDAELDHYFTVAKSLNLFASLVETRSLLGRDVTIADLNHIRNKEGLSLASVIQPVRQPSISISCNQANVSPLSSQQQQQQSSSTPTSSSVQQSPQKSPPTNCDKISPPSSLSPRELAQLENYVLNQPLMKALSHFISLHHPCHHDRDCKKLLKDIPLEEEAGPTVSITAGNLRQGTHSFSNSKESKPGRSRSSLKQAASAAVAAKEEMEKEAEDHQPSGDSVQSPPFDDWTREEVELFSKAIEVCDGKKKSNQSSVDTTDGCSSPEKTSANNNGGGGGSGNGGVGGPSSASGKNSNNNIANATNPTATTSSSSRTTNNSNNDHNHLSKTLTNSKEENKHTSSHQDDNKVVLSSKPPKSEAQDLNGIKTKATPKSIDPRMSIYNFDEEFKEDSPVRFDCPRPGAEVKPLKAKPIVPNTSLDSEATNSNVGSLKFFMDGQLVLKLNACQEQQEGSEKCHWVQSGDRSYANNRNKRYTKKAEKSSTDHNGSQSNSVVSSFQDDDSKSLTSDEDSKESMNSFTNLPQHPKSNHGSPTPTKRQKVKSEPTTPQQAQLPSPINYNRLAVNNRIKDRSDNLNPSPVINPAMPWLQANSLAMAAALLGRLPFPAAAGNIIDESSTQSNASTMNMASKPMDLSLEHSPPKPAQKSSSRSRNRSKNN